MYKSCNLILHGLCFFTGAVASCCNSPVDQIGNQKPPLLFENYKGELVPPEELFKKIREHSNKFKNGGCPESCKNCCFIQEQDWDEGKYINEVTITNFSCCNADCIYCANNLSSNERFNDYYNILPILKYYKDEGVLVKGCEFHISGGEFTIYQECDEILKEFGMTDYAKIIISSNCIRYSDALAKSMEIGSTYIIHSLDCGSRETFKKIKRVDAFDKVIDNLKKYTFNAKQQLTLKYIIIPNVNDNLDEFGKFLNIAASLQVRRIEIEIEGRYARMVNYKISPYFVELAEKMKQMAIPYGFYVGFFPFLRQAMHNNVYKKQNGIQNFCSKLRIRNDNSIKKLYISQKY